MRTVVFYNMGNRDVRDAGAVGRTIARQHGDALLKMLENGGGAADLSLPILAPSLTYVIEQVGIINRLVLFGTDQPETGAAGGDGVAFRDRDTWPYARVAQKLLKAQHGGKAIQKISLLPIQITPSNYDEAFTAYGELLKSFARNGYERCYVVAAGGTPACNMGLLLQAIRLFGDRCRTLYQPERQHPFELRIGEQIMDVLQTNAAAQLVERNDFAGAALLVKNTGLQAILHYADARAAFDFDQAQRYLQTALREMGAVRLFGQQQIVAFRPILTHSELALIAELVANAALCWQSGRIVDFLGRCFRINEAILHYLIHALYPSLSTDGSDATALAHLEEITTVDSDLDHFLNQIKGHDGLPLRRDELTRPLMLGMVRYAALRGTVTFSAETLDTVITLLQRIDQLSALRNKSIIAHGYLGVSAESVRKIYGTEPLADCYTILTALNIEPTDPFQTVRHFVQEQLSL